jgi:hypothetical protein
VDPVRSWSSSRSAELYVVRFPLLLRRYAAHFFLLPVSPRPLIDLGLVHPILVRIIHTVDLHVAQHLFGVGAGDLQGRHAINHIDSQTEPIDLILNSQIQRRVDVSLFLVTAHVEILVIGTSIGQTMDQPGIAVKVEDDGFIFRE